jgi:hypothetical protein
MYLVFSVITSRAQVSNSGVDGEVAYFPDTEARSKPVVPNFFGPPNFWFHKLTPVPPSLPYIKTLQKSGVHNPLRKIMIK